MEFGSDELKAIDEGRRTPDGHRVATAGRILGIIGTVLMATAIVAVVLAVLVFVPTSVTTEVTVG